MAVKKGLFSKSDNVKLRKGEISQGKAAELLEISRHDLFDLMAKYDIPVFKATSKELKEGLENLKEALRAYLETP